jgi:hypothetical protein
MCILVLMLSILSKRDCCMSLSGIRHDSVIHDSVYASVGPLQAVFVSHRPHRLSCYIDGDSVIALNEHLCDHDRGYKHNTVTHS